MGVSLTRAARGAEGGYRVCFRTEASFHVGALRLTLFPPFELYHSSGNNLGVLLWIEKVSF